MKIYSINDTLLLNVAVDDSSYRHRVIKGEHNLVLKYALSEHVELPVGAYCVFQNERYTLESPESFKMRHSRNFEYTVTMEAYQSKSKIWKFRNTVDGRLKFPLTACPIEHLQMFVDNMNRRDSGWSVGECIEDVEHLISYDHDFCWDALGKMASEFNTEFEIVGKRVSLCKVEYNKSNPLSLSYGQGNGFKSGVGRSNGSETPPVEILYAQGGSQNIDRSKYGNGELLLPKGQSIAYDGEHFEGEAGFSSTNARHYLVDDSGLSIRRTDKSMMSLAEDSLDCSTIYPKRVGTVSSMIVVDAAKYFYDIVDDSIPLALDYEKCLIAGEKMTIIFQSGMLAGREFEVKYYHDAKMIKGVQKAARRFEIVPQEIDGVTMPNATFSPRTGDKYAVFKVMLPQAYICDNTTKTGAEWDMFKTAVKYLFDNEEQKFSFTGELDGIWAKKDWINIGGRIVLGGYIRFSDERFQKEGVLLRITGIKDYINRPHSPVIEISNKTVSGSFSNELKKIESGEVLMEKYHNDALQYTKRRFRDAKETMELLQSSMLEDFTSRISPIAIRTMQMLVGDESLQFRFVNGRTNPVAVSPKIVYDSITRQLKAETGTIQHLTLGISSLSSKHKTSEYRFWNVAAFVSAFLNEPSKPYYLYIKAETKGYSASFILSERAIKMEEVSGFYHFLVGVLNSEHAGGRSFTTLYGYTEVLPGRMTTDRIVSGDGNSYFDMLANALKLGDKLQYNVDGNGLLKFRGTLVQSESGDEFPLGCFRGVFNSSYTYYKGDEVTFIASGNSSTYRYINDIPGSGFLPTDTSHWAVIAQGQSGQPGEKGKDGDGVEYIYKLSEIEKAPSTPTSVNVAKIVPTGWTDNPSGVSADFPFEYVSIRKQANGVWSSWSTPQLWANYATWNKNLLEQTEFESLSKMGKWDVRSIYPGGGTDNNVPHINNNGKDGQNFYADINVRRHSESLYKDVLRQPLFNSAIKKLQPSTWYTFSFWERSGVNDLVVNQTSSDYGFATKQLYLFKGQKYKLYVNGRIDRRAQLDGKTLTIFLYNDSWSWVKDVRITSTFNTTAFLEFNDVPADGEYTMSAYLYDNTAPRTGKATLNWVRLSNEGQVFQTYIFPSLVDTTKAFIDGEEVQNVSADLATAYSPAGASWRKHVITFKTKGSIPSGGAQNLLFRLRPASISGQQNYLHICMPKLEVGKVATDYFPNAKDMGADYQEYRFAKNGSTTAAPYINKNAAEPSGWTVVQPVTGKMEYLWVSIAKKSAEGALLTPWSDPIRMTPYDGKDGVSPALVFCGMYDNTKTYYGNQYRVDACKYGNTYYVCRVDAGEVKGILPTNISKWNSFGASFESIATNLLLAEGANIGDWFINQGRIVSTLADGRPVIRLDATVPRIEIESLRTGAGYGAYGQSSATNKPSKLAMDAHTGQFEARNRDNDVAFVSANGIFVNHAMTYATPAATGRIVYGAVVGLGGANVDKDPTAFDEEETVVTGVYGAPGNRGTAPSYGGYFEGLKICGLAKKLYYFFDNHNNRQLEKKDTTVIGLVNRGRINTLYLPRNAYEGQEIEVIQMGGGVTRVDTNDGTKLFDDESENDYYDIQCGMTGVFRRASWAKGGNAVEIWIVRRYNFL